MKIIRLLLSLFDSSISETGSGVLTLPLDPKLRSVRVSSLI